MVRPGWRNRGAFLVRRQGRDRGMDTLLQESTFDDQRFEDLQRNFILSDRFTGLAEFLRTLDP
jgi:hypothetical protein